MSLSSGISPESWDDYDAAAMASALIDEIGRAGATRVADLKEALAADTQDRDSEWFWAEVQKWLKAEAVAV